MGAQVVGVEVEALRFLHCAYCGVFGGRRWRPVASGEVGVDGGRWTPRGGLRSGCVWSQFGASDAVRRSFQFALDFRVDDYLNQRINHVLCFKALFVRLFVCVDIVN